MSNLLELLIPKTYAQADSTAQPTFGPIDFGGGSTITGSVLLTSNKTAVRVGETFVLSVEVKTNDVNISEYRISIDFDPTKFQVVDADPSTAGTQIKFADTVFEVENPAEDNLVANVGRVRLRAVAPSQPLTVNTKVAEITFQAQSVGSSQIKVVEGTTGTQLVRQTGAGLAYTPNEITMQVQTQQSTTGGQTTTGSTPSTTGGQTPTTGTTGTTGQQIPDTALPSDIASVLSVLIGLIFVTLGTQLVRNRKRTEV